MPSAGSLVFVVIVLKKTRGVVVDKLILIVGPTAVGKDTILDSLITEVPILKKAVSYTTRARRAGELDRKDYYFCTVNEFNDTLRGNHFLEYDQPHGFDFYGLPQHEVRRINRDGHIPITIVSIGGLQQIIVNNNQTGKDNVISFFIMPPSVKELERRFLNDPARKGISKNELRRRLESAKQEIEVSSMCKYVIINHRVEVCVREIIDILKDEGWGSSSVE